jgi:hypothetical protein
MLQSNGWCFPEDKLTSCDYDTLALESSNVGFSSTVDWTSISVCWNIHVVSVVEVYKEKNPAHRGSLVRL